MQEYYFQMDQNSFLPFLVWGGELSNQNCPFAVPLEYQVLIRLMVFSTPKPQKVWEALGGGGAA